MPVKLTLTAKADPAHGIVTIDLGFEEEGRVVNAEVSMMAMIKPAIELVLHSIPMEISGIGKGDTMEEARADAYRQDAEWKAKQKGKEDGSTKGT
jgi:hypothetical protein